MISSTFKSGARCNCPRPPLRVGLPSRRSGTGSKGGPNTVDKCGYGYRVRPGVAILFIISLGIAPLFTITDIVFSSRYCFDIYKYPPQFLASLEFFTI